MNRRQFLTINRNRTAAPATARALGAGTRPAANRHAALTERQRASRFLAQATLGATPALIDAVATQGIEAWLDTQFDTATTSTVDIMRRTIAPQYQLEEESFAPHDPFRWAWWQAVMTGPDPLRQRVAMALSEIFVISTNSELLAESSLAVGYFYDLLLKHAFGNFRDLLFDVTLSPAMGYYLSHAGNRKADPAANRFPDENYAREVMQLFSIGLFELNLDGSRKRGASGNPIATYGNDDIKEFAKIFTGLTFALGAEAIEDGVDPAADEYAFAANELTLDNGAEPMVMVDDMHEPGPKRLLNGTVVPAGQTGMQDVAAAIDNLANHPNVGPFIARRLIQRLVKSNPSPAYISRVARAFNDNGRGTRGDLRAVVRAILLDDEARDPAHIADGTHGMLREPFVRYTQLLRAFGAHNEAGENLFFNSANEIAEQLGQYPFAAPSVFNFFAPDFTPIGPLEQAGLHGPEFQITTSVSSVKLSNYWDSALFDGFLMEVPQGLEPGESEFPDDRMPRVSTVVLDLSPYATLAGDIHGLIDELDLLLTYGSLSDSTRAVIHEALTALTHHGRDWEEVVRFAIVLFMNAPDYVVQK